MDGDAGFERWELTGIWRSRICPRRVITNDTSDWLHLHSHYTDGHLLYQGGVFDQPAIYLEAMRVIQIALSKADG